MELTVIGSGTVAPSATRTAAAHWVQAGPTRLLLDCGPGTLHRAACFGIPWATVTHVAVTHFHQDHWGELPMLLFALRWGVLPPRSDRLTLIGPSGFRGRLVLLAAAYGDWVLDPGYPLEILEISPGTDLALDPSTVLAACPTPHTPESLAYAVRSGSRRLVYTGDTGASDTLARWAEGSDLLLAECSLPDGQGVAIHLTPTEAGALAREARVGRLVLTHFYPQVEGTDPAAVAARAFGGEVIAARDGDQFRL